MSARLSVIPSPADAPDPLLDEVMELFDRVDAYAESADFAHALDCLAAGESLCGGLTPGYLAKRVRWTAILEAGDPRRVAEGRWLHR
jgi:hypothetical protein